jgi:hypothetical protein
MEIISAAPEERSDEKTTHEMQSLSAPERRAVMSRAAATLANYYRTDPEIAEWQALDGEIVYDFE